MLQSGPNRFIIAQIFVVCNQICIYTDEICILYNFLEDSLWHIPGWKTGILWYYIDRKGDTNVQVKTNQNRWIPKYFFNIEE